MLHKILKSQLKETKEKHGLIGKAWDGIKNLIGLGAGSNKAEAAIEKLEKGEISEEEALKAVDGYQKGQKQCVDMVADIRAGIAAFAACSLATGHGIAVAPFTGRAVTGKVGVTAVSEGAGIVVKEGIKNTARGAITKNLLTTSVKYTGGTMGTRALALGTDMAVNGAISEALDSGVRYIAGDQYLKSIT